MFLGGRIHADTGDDPDWLLVASDRIVACGRRSDMPAADRTIDLQGGTLSPAFCDAHVHLPATGLYELGLDFRGETSVAAIREAFRARASGSGLLFGGNFEDPLDARLDASTLDDAVGDRSALLTRADMHSCVVSSRLLMELELEDTEGVDRDHQGNPTGYLREQAAAAAFRWFEAQMDRAEQIEAIRAAVRRAYSKGVASVHEMFVVEWRGWAMYEVFETAIGPEALNVLTYLGTDEVDKVAAMGQSRIGGDFFLDGSFGSHTAWLSEPYATPPPPGSTPVGIAYRSDDELLEFFAASQRAGLQVGVHAIGDAAIEQCISAWEKVASSAGVGAVSALGHRIEHFECARDDHIARAGRLGLRASVQPAFDAFWGGDGGLYRERIGPDRALQMNRFGTMLRAGLELGAGSDSTVTPLDPFLQMRALRDHNVPGERLSAADALRLHTRGGHRLGRQDDERGLLARGYLADLVWLDADPLTVEPDELSSIEVCGTWVAGARVWPVADAEGA